MADIKLNRTGLGINVESLEKTLENWDNIEKALKQTSGESIGAKENALIAKRLSEVAKDLAEFTQQQLDTVILENGNSDAEVVQARGGEDLLYKRLDKTEDNLSDAFIRTNDSRLLARSITKMRDGLPLKIISYGDSITFGWEPFSGNQVSKPYPLRLQEILREYYSNRSIDVLNKGTGGWKTTEGVSNLENKVLAESPDLVIIMFGINDVRNGISDETYRQNLTTIVKELKSRDVEVIMMASTPITDTTNGNNSKLISFTKIVKEVADSYSVAFLDMQALITKMFFSKEEDSTRFLPDKLHFANDKYFLIADFLAANLLFSGSNILNVDDNTYIPIVNSPYVQTDLKSTSENSASFYKSNYVMNKEGTTGTYLTFNFFVNKKGLSLYIQSPRNLNGGQLIPTLDGSQLPATNFYIDDSTAFETQSIVAANLPIGFHSVKFSNSTLTQGFSSQVNPLAYFTNFIFRKEETLEEDYVFTASASSSAPVVEKFKKIIDGKLKFTNPNTSSGVGTIMLKSKKAGLKQGNLVLEVEGIFYNGCGFTWFGNKADNGTNNRQMKVNSGYMVYLQNNATKLYNFKSNNVINEIATFSTTNNLLVKKLIRVEHSIGGRIKVFVDGVLCLDKVDNNIDTGDFGFYAYNSGTMEIDRFEYCYRP